MKAYKEISIVMAAGAAAALVLRLVQTLTGFEKDTGLAIAGHPAALALAAVLAVTAVLLFLRGRQLPDGAERPFAQVFPADSPAKLTVIVLGIFLVAAGGALQVLFALMGSGMQNVMTGDGLTMFGVVWMGTVSPAELLLQGVLTLVSAVCLFPVAAACRREGEVGSSALLIPVVCMVARLVLLYRANSVDPVLQAYYVELLALAAVIVALYQLAGFSIGQGKGSRLAFFCGMAAVLCVAALGDLSDIATTLFHAGWAAVLLGFWLLYRPEQPAESV